MLISVILGSVLWMVLGMLWYSPKVFGKLFFQLSGATSDKASMNKIYLLAWINAFVLSWGVAYLLQLTQAGTFAKAITVSLVCWLALIATTLFSAVLWLRQSMVLFFIQAGYYLVGCLGFACSHTLWIRSVVSR